MKVCKTCGAQCDDNFVFCSNCGSSSFYSAQELAAEAAYQQTEAENHNRTVKKAWKCRIIAFAVIAVLVAIAATGIAIYRVYESTPLSTGMSKDEASQLMDDGLAYYEDGDYEMAIACFAQIPSDSRHYKKAQTKLQESGELYLSKIESEANDYVEDGDFSSAFSLLNYAKGVLTDNEDLQLLYEQICDSYSDEIVSRVDSYIENGGYDSAFDLINQAEELLTEDSDLQTAYDKTYTAYRTSIINQADSYVQSGQYEVALQLLTNIKDQYPEDTTLQEAYNSTLSAYQNEVRSDAMEQADNYVEGGDYANAISAINTAISRIGQDAELTARLTVYKDTYKDNILQQIDSVYKAEGYDSVISLLGQAVSVLPDDVDLANEYTLWKSRSFILLTDLDAYANDDIAVNGTSENTDNYGTMYTSTLWSHYSDDYIEYYLDGKYAKFNAILYVSYKQRNSSYVKNAVISVYGDDILLDTFSLSSSKDKPAEIAVDISDVEFLKITFSDCAYGKLALANPTVGW